MAKGYPDFFGFSMFPYYGQLYEEHDNTILAADTTFFPVDLAFKGVCRCGTLRFISTDVLDEYYLRLSVDGELIQRLDMPHDDDEDMSHYPNQPLVVVYRSIEELRVQVRVMDGISFNASLYLEVHNSSLLRTITVTTDLWFNHVRT